MLNKRIYFLFLLFLGQLLMAQDKFTISGYLKDAKNGEVLIGAVVVVKEKAVSVASNEYGFFSITLPQGTYTVDVNYIGYNASSQTVELTKNVTINIELKSEEVNLQEVIISDKKSTVENLEMGTNKLDIKTIKKVPAFLGEVDVLRSLQTLPGVSTVGEGAGGFNVRGGSIDQNLILLDEAPVYNSSHALGFFSVFNPDAVKDVKLIKGGIPSNYGGRLASILDVRLKDGNAKKFQMDGGLGLIFGRFSMEAPLKKDKSSFIVAGRRSWFDIFFPLSPTLKENKVYFYDLTAKVNYTINEKNRVFLSGYFGRDVLSFGNFGFNWGNTTATLRWNHLFSSKIFMNLTAFYSNYDYKLGAEASSDNQANFSIKSNIFNYSLKGDFTYYLNTKNTINFGAQSILYIFQPGKGYFASNGLEFRNELPSQRGLESSLYLSNEQIVSTRLSLQYGLRLTNFNYGADSLNIYADTTRGIKKRLIGKELFSSNSKNTNFNNLEPRFSLKYTLDEKSSIKLGYNRMVQYIHLLSNTTASIPLDVWTPSTNNIKPQISDQISAGYFKNFGPNADYEASFETYYKSMSNQIDYINNADLILNQQVEGEILSGKGRAYGAEFYVKRNKGKFNGWISYTLAKTERQVEGINNERWYPSRFDRRHNLVVVAIYDMSKRLNISSTFTLSTGTPATFPTNRYEIQGLVIPHNAYNDRNNYRIPSYHRLDLAVTLQSAGNELRRWKGSWVFSVYNVYARKNPFSVYFQQNANTPSITEAIRFVVVGAPIPSIAYNFTF